MQGKVFLMTKCYIPHKTLYFMATKKVGQQLKLQHAMVYFLTIVQFCHMQHPLAVILVPHPISLTRYSSPVSALTAHCTSPYSGAKSLISLGSHLIKTCCIHPLNILSIHTIHKSFSPLSLWPIMTWAVSLLRDQMRIIKPQVPLGPSIISERGCL